MTLDQHDCKLELRASIIAYCAAIGADPLLVQGAGGNVSWKDADTLWIKASGTWLADAAEADIFVPVDLAHLRHAIASDQQDVTPQLHGEATLRPSIETLLHALMPQTVVVHLHAIEILAYLVRADFHQQMAHQLGTQLNWVSTEYQKPGVALARAAAQALETQAGAQVLFLQNHGIVIGAASVAEVDEILRVLRAAMGSMPASIVSASVQPEHGLPYLPVADAGIQQLAMNPLLFDQLHANWALYPDHVVFLGARPFCYASSTQWESLHASQEALPELIFIRDGGVFARPGFSAAKLAQLRCYYDVLSRQPEGSVLMTLNDQQIAELLNWDAEQYRMHLAK